MKILVIDDSPAARMICTRVLQDAGYGDHDLLEAADPDQGFDTIMNEQPDLVLCDINMPKSTGTDLLKRVNEAGKKPIFGFITADIMPEVHAEARAAGASFIIVKPYTPAALREALEPFLG